MPSATKSAAQNSLDTIGALLNRLQKRAKEESDPGGFTGDTSHPTGNTENGTVDPTEGSRSRENEADVKHDQPAGVDVAVEGTPGGQEAVQLNIGTQQSGPDEGTAGNVPSIESKLPDPGGYEGDTSHPADLDTIGEKYGAARALRGSLEQVKEAGTALLAKIVMSKRAADEVLPPETPGPASGADDAKPSTASVTGGSGGEAKTDDETDGAKAAQAALYAKTQRDNAVVLGIAETMKSAQDNALIAADYLDGFFAQAGKVAGDDSDTDGSDSDGDGQEDDSYSSGSEAPPSDGGGSESGGPPSDGGSGGGDSGAGASGGGMDENALMQLLSGGGGGDAGGGGGMPSSEIGGGSAASEMLGPAPGGAEGGAPGGMGMGGPPDMGGGAPPMGGDPMGGGMGGGDMGMGGGGQMDPQQMQMLIEALAQLGITPQQAQQKAAQKKAAQQQQRNFKPKGWAPRNHKEAEQFESMKKVLSEIVS